MLQLFHIVIITIRNNTLLPMRYKFVHSIGTEMWSFGSDKLIERILGESVVGEALLSQEVVKMREVTISGRKV